MASLEKLYEAGEKLSKVVDQRLPQQSDELMRTEYGVILAGVKSNDPLARRLSSQFISRFFNHFPSLCSEALEAMLDLCEDDDVVVRKQAIKDLPQLCREMKQNLPKIADVLAQLLHSDDQSEHVVIHNSLTQLFRQDAKGTLAGLFSQVKRGSESVRSRAIQFLSAKVKMDGSTLLNKEAEFVLMKEIKTSLTGYNAEDFLQFMHMLRATKIAKTVTGRMQLLEIAVTMAELDKPFDSSDPHAVEKIVLCFEEVLPFLSLQVPATKFCYFLCHEVLPRLHTVADLGDQAKILKVLAEACMFTNAMDGPLEATQNIYKTLHEYMPLPPIDADQKASAGNVPEFEFTKVECLMLACHAVARHCPQYLTENEERSKDFRARLQYFSRCIQPYIKGLKDCLAEKTPIELRKEENKQKSSALKCATNIQTLIKDLFHTPPIFKAKVTASWRSDLAKKDSLSVSGSVTSTRKRKPITFDDDDSEKSDSQIRDAGMTRSGGRGKFHHPYTREYNSGFKRYSEDQGGLRRGIGWTSQSGRGRRYGSRGRFSY